MKKEYKLTINGRAPLDTKDHYEVGELVVVRLAVVTDVSMKVTSDGDDGSLDYINGQPMYSFRMPEHDVDVEVIYTSNMINDNTGSPAMAMMGKTLMNMYDSQVNNFGDPTFYNRDKSTNFCPECGMPKDKNKEYCPACEKRINRK